MRRNIEIPTYYTLAVTAYFAVLASVMTPFLWWPDAARSIVDQTLHGHLLVSLTLTLVLSAGVWVIGMGWWLDEITSQHPITDDGKEDKRWWKPRGSWALFTAALLAPAMYLMVLNSAAPAPGARETGQEEWMCSGDDGGDYGYGARDEQCDWQPILEPYRWGRPFLTRAERENILSASAGLVIWLPASLLAGWCSRRLKRLGVEPRASREGERGWANF